jgi:enoyl-CoA hydratase
MEADHVREVATGSYQHILVETHENVGLIRMDRPAARNALCAAMLAELRQALDAFEADDAIGAMVLTGSEHVFAAGADVKELATRGSFAEVHREDLCGGDWPRLSTCRKPVIAAVAGLALGGGSELAMMCDVILAADTAQLAHPEATLGTMSGDGGTQRLARLVGRSKAIDMLLGGRMMDAWEAERSGLVSRVIPAHELVQEALHTAARFAAIPRPVALLIKECVNQAYEMPLAAGLLFERRMFQATFALDDRVEGMAAFIAKRRPAFGNR